MDIIVLDWGGCHVAKSGSNFVDVDVLQRPVSSVWWSNIINSWRDKWAQNIWPEDDDPAFSPLFSRNKHLPICSILHWSRR